MVELSEEDKVAYENMLAFSQRKDVPTSARLEYQVFLSEYLMSRLIKTEEGKQFLIETAHCMAKGNWTSLEVYEKCKVIWE